MTWLHLDFTHTNYYKQLIGIIFIAVAQFGTDFNVTLLFVEITVIQPKISYVIKSYVQGHPLNRSKKHFGFKKKDLPNGELIAHFNLFNKMISLILVGILRFAKFSMNKRETNGNNCRSLCMYKYIANILQYSPLNVHWIHTVTQIPKQKTLRSTWMWNSFNVCQAGVRSHQVNSTRISKQCYKNIFSGYELRYVCSYYYKSHKNNENRLKKMDSYW